MKKKTRSQKSCEPAPLLSRDAILALKGGRYEDVPALGGTVRVAAVSAGARDAFELALQDLPEGERRKDFRARIPDSRLKRGNENGRPARAGRSLQGENSHHGEGEKNRQTQEAGIPKRPRRVRPGRGSEVGRKPRPVSSTPLGFLHQYSPESRPAAGFPPILAENRPPRIGDIIPVSIETGIMSPISSVL